MSLRGTTISEINSMRRINIIAASAALVVGAAFIGAHAADPANDPFAWVGSPRAAERSWPTSAMNPAVREEILRHKYTKQESRNIQTALENASGTGRALDPERWRSDKPLPAGNFRGGFYILHGFFGRPQRNGWYNPGFANQTKVVEDIFAKGDRVAVVWHITGNINGPFFGFDGRGQPIDTREQNVGIYDELGKVRGGEPWSGEDLVLYEQLGGKLSLPTGKK
jgi:hypothetical protein